MTFLDNFEQICRARGESPSHALEAAGINPSLYPKWKKKPDMTPFGSTIQKLADYFGCSFQTLAPSRYAIKRTETFDKLEMVLNKLDERDQMKILAYILFAYREELGDEVQKLQARNS